MESIRPYNPNRPYYTPQADYAELVKTNTNGSGYGLGAPHTPGMRLRGSNLTGLGLGNESLLDWNAIVSIGNTAIVRYISVFISQPFERAKTILQVQSMTEITSGSDARGKNTIDEDYLSSDEDIDDPNYFFNYSNSQHPPAPPTSASGAHRITDRQGYIYPSKTTNSRPSWQHAPQSTVRTTIRSIYGAEGIIGLWKGQNTAFVYQILSTTVQSFLDSFMAVLFNLPDPLEIDALSSPNMWASVITSLTAGALTSLLLAPIHIARTTIEVSPPEAERNGLLQNLRSLPHVYCPPSLIAPTVLASVLPHAASISVPIIIQDYLRIHPLMSPTLYSILELMGSLTELTIRLPLELILKRAELAYSMPKKTIVAIGKYNGLLSSLWSTSMDENRGLFRGWRANMYTYVSLWLLESLGLSSNSDQEF